MVDEKRRIQVFAGYRSGCHENLLRQNGFFEAVCFLSFAHGLCHILVRGSFLDINGGFGRFNMFHVCSSTAYTRDLLWPCDEDEVLVDHVDYDASLSRFPTVEFHTDASNFDCGHRDNLPRRLSLSKSSFKVSSISAGFLRSSNHHSRRDKNLGCILNRTEAGIENEMIDGAIFNLKPVVSEISLPLNSFRLLSLSPSILETYFVPRSNSFHTHVFSSGEVDP